MGDAMTYEPIGRTKSAFSRDAVTIIATLPSNLVSALQASSRSLALADDIAMLAVLGTTLARWSDQAATTVAMIVPQRDGPSESDLIGLFADIRLLDVRTAGLSYAGVALWLQNVVKERLWRSLPVGTQFDNPLINFEWTDFESREGFSLLPQVRNGPENGVCNPVKIAVDQPDRLTWRMRVAFDTALYTREDRERFFSLFRECLQGFVCNPLAPVWSPSSIDTSAQVCASAPAESGVAEAVPHGSV